jgi:HPr kinase/phosphorylase
MASSRRRTIHGVLVQVFGVGVLILGDSGTGKTKSAIQLMTRGHKLVADDAVELTVSDNHLSGTAPLGFRHIANIRPGGLIDLTTRFGAESFIERTEVMLVIRLIAAHERAKQYVHEVILGISIPAMSFVIDRSSPIGDFVEAAARAKKFQRTAV